MSELLPVHGFVLAGGKSARMGQDKALLPFRGVPMIEIAVSKLRSFCSAVSILGSRDDLRGIAPTVHDLRSDIGPGAALESALAVAQADWSLIVPVDVPLLPTSVLEHWCREVLATSAPAASFLVIGVGDQPAFALLHQACTEPISRALDRGERKLIRLLYAADDEGVAPVAPRNVQRYAMDATETQLEFWFSNVNTPQELAEAEAWAGAEGWQPSSLR